MDPVMVAEVYCDPNVVFLFGKKKFRNLFWKVRKQLLNNNSTNKKHKYFSSFQYDPLSYALNFDDGYCGFFCL